MTNLLVIGASRGIGAQVAIQAVQQGHCVRAMSRGGKLPSGLTGGCEGYAGNALNAEHVKGALDGIDAVVQALGIELSPKMFLEPVTLFSQATQVLLPQMEEMQVQRLVSVTGFGAGDSRSSISCIQRLPFQLLLKNAYDDKTEQEELIQQSNLDWLIVRPGVLTSAGASQKYRVLLEQDEWRNGIISRADVAAFITSQLAPGSMTHQKPVLIRYPL